MLVIVFDVTPDCWVNVRLAGSEDFFLMPASPVCRDTLVSATAGAALNLESTYALENVFSTAGKVEPVGRTALTGPVCSDIEHPLLLSDNSHNILMRELFPHSIQKASHL